MFLKTPTIKITTMNNPIIYVSWHAVKRFKQRENVKSIPKMYRRANQAYQRGCLLETDIEGNKLYLFNGAIYVFNEYEKNSMLLLTLYKVNTHNGIIKLFLQTNCAF